MFNSYAPSNRQPLIAKARPTMLAFRLVKITGKALTARGTVWKILHGPKLILPGPGPGWPGCGYATVCTYVCMCVCSLIPAASHIGITKERYQRILRNTGIVLNFADFPKNASFKSYGVICLPGAALAS